METHAVGLRGGTGRELSTNIISNVSVTMLFSRGFFPLLRHLWICQRDLPHLRQQQAAGRNQVRIRIHLYGSDRSRWASQSRESTSSSSRWGQAQGYSQGSFPFCFVTGQIAVVEATEFVAAATIRPGVFRLTG